MVRFVDAGWLEERLPSGSIRVVDPRRPVRYLQGHLRGAVNVPVAKAFDGEARLLPEDQLAAWLGRCGVGTGLPVVVYDEYDGQSGAMLAWILEYLGHPDVRFLDASFDAWVSGGREVFYRPVAPQPAAFAVRPRPELRAGWSDLAGDRPLNILDTRSPEEYAGAQGTGGRAGHIPGARNISWLRFVQEGEPLFRSERQLRELLAASGIDPGRRTVTYCQVGVRAAVAFLALQRLGCDVALYDGSFADWARRPGLPVEG